MSRHLVYDIETKMKYEELRKDMHILDQVDGKILSLCITDVRTKEKWSCTDEAPGYTSVEEGLNLLRNAERIIGHNICGFDNTAVADITGNFKPVGDSFDTLIMSQLLYPLMFVEDKKRPNMPKHLKGKHSLKAWGYRLTNFKTDYTGGFQEWSKEMQDYCEQDVEVSVAVYEHLLTRNYSDQAIILEGKFLNIITQQTRNGVHFDSEGAEKLYLEIEKELKPIKEQIQNTVPAWVEKAEFTPKVNNKTRGYIKGETIIRTTTKPFNPNSRQQIVKYLKERYSWKPTVFTDTGQPKIDSEVMASLPYPEADIFAEFLVRKALMSKIKDAKGGWLNITRKGKLHGKMSTLGTRTRRCSHCVPLTTRALTRSGWKYHNEISIGDEILGYNIEKDRKEWTKVTAINTGTGNLGFIGNQSTKLQCTEDHKWVVAKRSRRGPIMKLLKASEILSHDAILMNAPYSDFCKEDTDVEMVMNKHEYNHLEYAIKMSKNQAKAYMLGFLLADGCLQKSTNGTTKSWTFSQSEGTLLDTFQTMLFLLSGTRITRTCKSKLKGENQRWGYTVRYTQAPWLRAGRTHCGKEGMKWTYTHTDEVWCPTTDLGTWAMLQEDGVMCLTGNSSPNISQVPSPGKYKGEECRSLFYAPEGFDIVGSDMSGIQLRMLAHYLAPYDGGRYAEIVLNGDIHTSNQEAAGLPTRPLAKTFIYAWLFGAGSELLGAILEPKANSARKKRVGDELRKSFMSKTPGISQLIADVQRAHKRGFMKLIDGGRVISPSSHTALNTLLQGSDSVCCKTWVVHSHEQIVNAGLDRYARNVIQSHDEQELVVSSEYSETVGGILVKSARDVGDLLGTRIRLDAEYKIGRDWLAVH